MLSEYERECMRKTRLMLGRWGCAMMEIRRMERRSRQLIDLLLDIVPTLQAQKITDMPRGSGVSDPVGRAVEQMEARRGEYQKELDAIDAEIRQRQDEYRAMEDKITACLTDLQKQILDLYYRENRSMEYIAGKIGYSREGIKKIENRAVLKLSRRIE